MTYAELVTALEVLAMQLPPATADDFLAYIPTAIANAELRIYRDMSDLLASRGQNTNIAFTANSPLLSLNGLAAQVTAPIVFQGATLAYTNPVTVERVEALVTATAPSTGLQWVSLLRSSLEFVQMTWPNTTLTAAPVFGSGYYCLLDDRTVLVAPTPDAAYPARITGTWRPATLSEANPSSYLSVSYPDLLLASAMLEITGYMANWGSQADDPKQAVSWLQMYGQRLAAAKAEEMRRRGMPPSAAPMPAQAGTG